MDIPRRVLLATLDERLRQLRFRALPYGGTWFGVETMVMDVLEARDFLLAWPEPPPHGGISQRWHMACSHVHPNIGSIGLTGTLEKAGMLDSTIQHKVAEAINEFVSCDGLYPRRIAHHECKCHTYHPRSTHPDAPHCSGDCGIWPCPDADGEAVAVRYRERYAKAKAE